MASTESPPDDLGHADTAELFDAWCRHQLVPARDELIRRHLPLARRLASRYVHPGDGVEDLVQVASVGLINAVERFDPDHGTAFSSFAVPTILGEIKRHFRDTSWAVRVDRRTQERASAITAAERELSAGGRAPTVPELADHLGCSETEVLDALEASSARSAMSLDAPVLVADTEPAASRLGDTVGHLDSALEAVPDRADIGSAIRHLPRLERRILYLRFTEDLSQREIADQVGVSQMHVSRLLRHSLSALHDLVDDTLDAVPRPPEAA